MPNSTDALTDEIIKENIAPGSRVIDLGCGDGRLLERLRDEHDCSVLGVEVDLDEIHSALLRGVSIIQGDLDEGLPDIPSGTFDFAVLSQTLQQVRHPKTVLEEITRVSRKALVLVPNFAHWRVRLQVLKQGRAPVTESLPYDWYNTPNLHIMSMFDFRDLAVNLGLQIIKELPIIGGRAVDRAWGANLRAESALYVLETNNSQH
jgi:methionine biosynthesis protein MetW